jgi:aerobic carbon-monoxide dehydrogenase medium subunit
VKPSRFDYYRPDTVEEALAVLAEVGDTGKVLAGGQSLLPLLNMRLAAPAALVDINRLPDLDRVHIDETGVRVGALVRHAALERNAAAAASIPMLRQAVRNVAHATIRNRGTTVGSIVHADPAGEMTAVLALLGGVVELCSSTGHRRVAATDFFLAPLESDVRAGELATSAYFVRPPARTGSAWHEMSRRHGDYALCGVGALVTIDDDDRILAARAGYISVSSTPVVLDLTDAVGGMVAGAPADHDGWTAAGRLAESATDPEADIHATADYRRHLVGVLTARALRDAARHATGDSQGVAA